jgi:hypothetical protein
MAVYQDNSFLIQCDYSHFNLKLSPGAKAVVGGIYRCTCCGEEIAAGKGQQLPGQGQHAHAFEFGPPTWQLIVLALSPDAPFAPNVSAGTSGC